MFLNSEAIDYINSETDDGAYSYSFWARMAVGADTDGNFDPFIGFYRADGTYAGVFEQRWRTNMKYVVNGIGDSTVGAPGDSGTYLQNGSATPGDEGWHFYTVTENEGSGTLYLDGQPVGTYTVDADHLSEKPFAFFEVGGGMEKLWLDKNNRGRLIGAVDDIAIYSGVLTAEQVAAAYEEKQDQIDSDPEPLPSRADGEEAEADTGFLPAFPVYDRAADAGEGLTVTAERAVSGVAGLSGDSVTVSGQELSFTAEYLSSLDCGIHELSVQYSDGGSGVLPLTVTDSSASSPVPVLSYTMSADAISGGALEDQSVYGMDARISSVESGMSHDGTAEGAAVFDGYQYADPDYATLDGEGALWLSSVLREGYSINFWMNASEENGSVMSMLGLYAADGRPLGAVESFDLSSSSTDKSQDGTFTLQYDMAADPETQFTVRSAENAVHTGEWHQITATYDRAGQTICLYLDGQLCSTQENVTADILGQIAAFRIGSPYKKYYRSSGSEDWLTRGGFKGSMDSVTVYPAALTAEQVAELYGDGPSSAKPVIRFTMDAATLDGETILDESGVAGGAANVTPVAGADGQEGGALYFDGTADAGQYSRLWLEQEGIDLLNDAIGSQATIAYWMKPDTTRNPDHTAYSGNWSPVLGLYGGDTRFLMVAEYRNGALNYCCTIPNVNDKRTIGDPLDGDTWYYVVMTFDGSRTESVNGKPSMYRRLYICNASTGEVQEYRPDREAVSEDLFDNIAYFEIGGQPRKGWWTDTNVRGRYIGAVDEVEIYNVPFSAEDVAREFEESVQTVQGLYLPKSFCQADLAGGRDLTVEVANGGQLSGIDGLESSGYLMEEGLLTIRAAALEALGAGTHVLNLRFADGSCTLTVEITDSRSAFSPAVPVFEKSSPADVQLTCGTFAGTPVSVTASGLEAEDYTVSGNTITISQRYLMDQQPGAVQLTVSASDGTSAQAVIHVTNAAGEGTEPFPVLYYKMDAPDLSPDGQGSSSGRLTEHSGHGISARYSGLESAGADQNGVENGTLFFDGYRDMDISRVYLDQAGMDYLKAVVDNQVSYSFWLSSDRITSNYMPVMGLYGADGRPAAVAQFNSSGGERSGIGAAAAPALVTTPLGSLDPNASHTAAEKTAAMDSTWHHYVVTYDGETGVTAVYVDGTLAATGSAAPDQLADMTSFEIGGLLNTTYYQYGSNLSTWNRGRLYGYLDEVKVYNVALSGSQAESLYQMGVDSELPQDTPEEPAEAFENENAPLALTEIGRYDSGESDKDGGVMEIVAYNAANQYAYAVNGKSGKLVIVPMDSLTSGDSLSVLTGSEFDVKTAVEAMDSSFSYGDMTSVAVSPDGSTLAAAIQAAGYNDAGRVALFTCGADGSLTLTRLAAVGVQPDMVTFADNGTVLTADEGEPREGYSGATDPEGSVSIVDAGTGTSSIVKFTVFDAQRQELLDAGVVLKKGTAPSVDLEPEYIAVSGRTAYVTLQEANAIAVLDLKNAVFTGVYSAGFVDYSQVKVDLDNTSDPEDGGAAYTPANYADTFGLRMPDGIAAFTAGGRTYLVTANEGDSREWGDYNNENEKKLVSTGGAETAKKVRILSSDYEGPAGLADGSSNYLFGSRSFTVFEVDSNGLTVVFDSADDFERLTNQYLPAYFNCSNDDVETDGRSNKKGPEPESVVIGAVGGKTYAFVTLERIGGVMVYDVSTPSEARFVNYMNSRDFASFDEDADRMGADNSPEGLAFVPAAQSSTGKNLLLAACEVGGTLAVYELTPQQNEVPEEPEEPDGGDEDGGSSGSSSGSSRYTVAVASGINHGTLSVSPSRASEGDTVTITVTPDSGYELDWLTVSSLAGSQVEVERLSDLRYTFQMPRSRVTVNAQFTPQQSAGEPASGDGQVLSFDDVPEDAWYYDAVQYVCGRGLMQGTGSASFSPADTTTRSMIVTILYRLEGEPPVSAASPFTDVGSGQWYSDAVIWAASNGIADGYGTGLFGPADTITREQTASILYRYTQYKGGDTAQSGDLSTFSDGGSTAAWARGAMSWAIGSGLLSGKDGGRLDPQGNATRAEAATILMRYCQSFLG